MLFIFPLFFNENCNLKDEFIPLNINEVDNNIKFISKRMKTKEEETWMNKLFKVHGNAKWGTREKHGKDFATLSESWEISYFLSNNLNPVGDHKKSLSNFTTRFYILYTIFLYNSTVAALSSVFSLFFSTNKKINEEVGHKKNIFLRSMVSCFCGGEY